MQTYKCEMCGAGLDPQPGAICTCKYCGTKYSLSGVGIPDKSMVTQNPLTSLTFSLQAEGVFSLAGRGIAVTGEVAVGEVYVNDNVKIVKSNGSSINCVVTAIEQFRRMMDCAKKGDKIGLILGGVAKAQIEKGDIIIKGELDIPAIEAYVKGRYLPSGEKVKAIDFYRRATGVGLKEAKERVDAIFSRR
ncbi:MAG: hypothetical protein E7490_09285 [Ruminococcaceae bacterium]|nr:hypothetical protein [Oscillospiraceae bacterium]